MRTITKLNLNRNPLTVNSGESRNARNIVTTNDQKAIRNENGFLSYYTATGIIIGNISLPDGYVLFVKNDTDKILYFKDDVLVKTIESDFLNFDLEIKGIYTYNAYEELVIVFSEGNYDNANETRIINITTSKTVLDQTDVDKLNLSPEIQYPKLSPSLSQNGGLKTGSYEFCIAYVLDDGSYSNFSTFLYPVIITGSNLKPTRLNVITNKSIDLAITNFDTRYDKFVIGVLYKGGDSELAYYSDELDIVDSDNITIKNIDNYHATSIDRLTINSIPYIKDEDLVEFKNKLYRLNVTTIDYTGLDDVMKDIAANCTVSVVESQYSTLADDTEYRNRINKHFKEFENYMLYIGAIDNKGNLINTYFIQDYKVPRNNNNGNLLVTAKCVYNIRITPPADVLTRLGNFTNTIKSFVYFYAEASGFNNNFMGQAFVIRDTDVNTFDDQIYTGQFRSPKKLRLYTLEALFNKTDYENVGIAGYTALGGFTNDDTDNDVDDAPDDTRLHKVFNNLSRVIVQDEAFNRDPLDRKAKFIHLNNTAFDNIAGDSYLRMEFAGDDLQAILGGPNGATAGTSQSFVETDVLNPLDDTGVIRWYLMGTVDIFNYSNIVNKNPYNQKLCVASPIVNVTEAVTLQGDFFYDFLTVRLTAPLQTYRYGTSNASLQDDYHVYKLIISCPLESRYNAKGRYSGNNSFEEVKMLTEGGASSLKEREEMYEIEYIHDNFINTTTGLGYDKVFNNNGYDYIETIKELDKRFKFTNRLIYSNVNAQESDELGWRVFTANSYKDIPLAKGSGVALNCDDKSLYIQLKHSLFVAFIKDVLSNTEDGGSYLSTADVLDRDPIEIVYDKNGYIGCESRFNCIVSPAGYFVVDTVKKNIFLATKDGAAKLNDTNTDEWFYNNIEKGMTNPYIGYGIALLYDDINKSIFFTHNGFNYIYTLQYNLALQGWLSFHDYYPKAYISCRDANYSLSDTRVFKRHQNNKGVYMSNDIYKSFISLIFNEQTDVYKQLLSMSWNTRVSYLSQLFYDLTIDKIMVYNDTQCTGYIPISKPTDWFDTKRGVYVRDMWHLNDLYDIVKDDKQPIIDNNEDPIDTNLDTNQDWFFKDHFISKYFIAKLVIDNEYINLDTRQKSNSADPDAEQLEVIIDDLLFNISKAIR